MNYLLGERLRFDWKIVTVTIVSTLVILLDYYRKLTFSEGIDKTIYFLFIPLFFIIVIFREDPRELGLTLGDWKAGLLFTYARKYGADALWLQAVPFAIAHMTKPEIETLSTIFGGFAFGWVAYRTRSFLYPLLIHWFVSSFTIIVAAGLLG